MGVNANLRETRQLLSDAPETTEKQATTIERLGESNPKTAKLFERRLISLEQMRDRLSRHGEVTDLSPGTPGTRG